MTSMIARYAWPLVAVGALLAMPAVPAGCTSDGGRSNEATLGAPEFEVRSSAEKVLVGETVTATTWSTNLAGRASEIQWSTTGGELSTEQNGRVARVRFDRPGTYMISATLLVEGEPIETDMVQVNALPLGR